jgi:hypothetical protein
MTGAMWAASARDARNAALLDAEVQRSRATRDADIEYSETVLKLRERFEADLAEAARRRLETVAPAHRAYVRAVVAAERLSAQFVR